MDMQDDTRITVGQMPETAGKIEKMVTETVIAVLLSVQYLPSIKYSHVPI